MITYFKNIPKSFLLALTILTVTVSSCNQSSDSVKELETEVMMIHDEVMPKMGILMNLKKQLKLKVSELDSSGSTNARDSLVILVRELEEADEQMMEWMRNYKKPSEEMSMQQAIEYLNEEKKKIQQVKEKMNSSAAAAKAALDK